jgi:hypothetical protein
MLILNPQQLAAHGFPHTPRGPARL